MELTLKEKEVIKHLTNWKIHTGEVPSYRKLMRLLGYKSTRSISLIILSLSKKNYLKITDNKIKLTNDFPITKWTDWDMFSFATFYAINYKKQGMTYETLLKSWENKFKH